MGAIQGKGMGIRRGKIAETSVWSLDMGVTSLLYAPHRPAPGLDPRLPVSHFCSVAHLPLDSCTTWLLWPCPPSHSISLGPLSLLLHPDSRPQGKCSQALPSVLSQNTPTSTTAVTTVGRHWVSVSSSSLSGSAGCFPYFLHLNHPPSKVTPPSFTPDWLPPWLPYFVNRITINYYYPSSIPYKTGRLQITLSTLISPQPHQLPKSMVYFYKDHHFVSYSLYPSNITGTPRPSSAPFSSGLLGLWDQTDPGFNPSSASSHLRDLSKVNLPSWASICSPVKKKTKKEHQPHGASLGIK